ncbi:hypothetical protein EVAR_49717_1 [Eumeta japonica]|uniref:Uncharacterized protein n=1 Tax=Eumeta variegata TaxID=151549 RepID=A0A4C1Z1D7_EUMVA|nr:hypothetical protein EVAR_49717_1 [Eumeta japonica]
MSKVNCHKRNRIHDLNKYNQTHTKRLALSPAQAVRAHIRAALRSRTSSREGVTISPFCPGLTAREDYGGPKITGSPNSRSGPCALSPTLITTFAGSWNYPGSSAMGNEMVNAAGTGVTLDLADFGGRDSLQLMPQSRTRYGPKTKTSEHVFEILKFEEIGGVTVEIDTSARRTRNSRQHRASGVGGDAGWGRSVNQQNKYNG